MLNMNNIPGQATAVTPSDSTLLPKATVALYVGGAGNLVVQCENNVSVTLVALAGSYHIARFKKVMVATTATAIVAFHGPAL